MTNDIVIVVTGLELGWDCVVGVFAGVTQEELEQRFPPDKYILTKQQVETNLIGYYD